MKNIILTLTILFLSISLISATNNIDNTQAQFSNTKINDSGMYYNDGNSYRGVSSGTADVVVCKSESLLNDYLPKWLSGCDTAYLCKSTDSVSTCSQKYQNAIYETGHIYFKKGTFTSSQLIIPSNTIIEGSGKGTILKATNSLNSNFLIINKNTSDVSVYNLKIDGNRGNNNAGDCIKIIGNNTLRTSRVYLNNLWITDCYSAGIEVDAIWLSSINNIFIDYSAIDDLSSGAMVINNLQDPLYLNNIFLYDSGIGLRVFNSWLLTGSNIEINNNQYHGAYLETMHSSMFNNFRTVNNGLFADFTYVGIYLVSSDYNMFNNVASYTEIGVSNNQSYEIVESGSSNHNLITNFYINPEANPTYSGIMFLRAGNQSSIRNTIGQAFYKCSTDFIGQQNFNITNSKNMYCNGTNWVQY